MKLKKLRIMLDPGAYMPTHAHAEDAGFDLHSPVTVVIPAGGSAIIDTGVHMEIPKGWYGNIQSKSGLNVMHDIVTTGTIDSGYTGAVKVKLYNLGDDEYRVYLGDKVAQIVFMQCAAPALIKTDEMKVTPRGNGGFGSTGR